MAVEIIPGETYTADFAYNGKGWSLFRVKAQKGSKEITVFTDGRQELKKGDRITVKKITKVKNGAKKDKNGEWQDAWSVTADVVVAGSYSAKLEDVPEEIELPF